jgi:hypothetical protein
MEDNLDDSDGTMFIGNMEVLEMVWYHVKAPIPLKVIGIITVKCLISGEIKKYIGLGLGENMIEDTALIVETGVPFTYAGIEKPKLPSQN